MLYLYPPEFLWNIFTIFQFPKAFSESKDKNPTKLFLAECLLARLVVLPFYLMVWKKVEILPIMCLYRKTFFQ